jgi:hypothetical protein
MPNIALQFRHTILKKRLAFKGSHVMSIMAAFWRFGLKGGAKGYYDGF